MFWWIRYNDSAAFVLENMFHKDYAVCFSEHFIFYKDSADFVGTSFFTRFGVLGENHMFCNDSAGFLEKPILYKDAVLLEKQISIMTMLFAFCKIYCL